jgi:universal stress protein E
MFSCKKILLCLDHDPTDQDSLALRKTCEFAAKQNATVTVVSVVKPVSRFFDFFTSDTSAAELENLLREDRQKQLDEFVTQNKVGDVACDTRLLIGKQEVQFIREVVRGNYNLLVKPAKGVSSESHPLTSLDKTLIRSCPCPVWLLNSEKELSFANVLAAIDVEDHDNTHAALNRSIITAASALSGSSGVPLHIVAAWDLWMDQPLRRRAGDYEVESWLAAKKEKSQQDLDELLAEMNVSIDASNVHLNRGVAAQVVEQVVQSEKIDLLVMGTVSRTGINGFLLGNTAETILSHAKCSILALKPEGFVCPIPLGNS